MARQADSEGHLLLATGQGPLPLGYTEDSEAVYLIARDRSSEWPIDLLRRGTAELRLPRGAAKGPAELVTEPDQRERILELFRKKYGPERYSRWYDHPSRVLRVRTSAVVPPTPAGAEPHYYDWLQAEFDNVAEDYDHHITGNRMNRLLRDRSLARLRPMFRQSHSLLEVGCGSGMETIPLLREGHEILAVDISDRMLEVVRKKARAEGISERLRTRHLPARELASLRKELGEGAFDGAYSTYGALNCEPDLRAIPGAFHSLLRPDAPLLLGIYNRWCLFELFGYSLSMQGGRAFGRRHNPVPVGASRFCIDVYAYSVADFRHLFSETFEEVRLEGVPVLLPPSDLTAYAEKFASHFPQLAALDAWAGRRWPLNSLGDHFLMTLRRRPLSQLRDPA